MPSALTSAFSRTEEDWIKMATSQVRDNTSGSTAVVAIIEESTLFIANVGDSRAMMCRVSSESFRHEESSGKSISISKQKNGSSKSMAYPRNTASSKSGILRLPLNDDGRQFSAIRLPRLKVQTLSIDHNTKNKAEKRRIIRAGGKIQKQRRKKVVG